MSLFKVIAYISAPVAFVKSGISLLHGYSACINLSIIDTKEREALRKTKWIASVFWVPWGIENNSHKIWFYVTSRRKCDLPLCPLSSKVKKQKEYIV